MKKAATIIALAVIVWFAFSANACAWIYYSKPAFRGRVIDAQTKQPLEGVVVVVIYKVHTIISGPGGGDSSIIKVKETLTDVKGEFYFPAYITLTGLNSSEYDTDFIIFMPGYKAIDGMGIINIPDEKYFSIQKDMIGKEGTIKYVDTSFTFPATFIWKGLMGIVELKKTTPSESMSGSMPHDYTEKDLPLLYKAIEEDDIIRGLLPKSGRKK